MPLVIAVSKLFDKVRHCLCGTDGIGLERLIGRRHAEYDDTERRVRIAVGNKRTKIPLLDWNR